MRLGVAYSEDYNYFVADSEKDVEKIKDVKIKDEWKKINDAYGKITELQEQKKVANKEKEEAEKKIKEEVDSAIKEEEKKIKEAAEKKIKEAEEKIHSKWKEITEAQRKIQNVEVANVESAANAAKNAVKWYNRLVDFKYIMRLSF